MALESERVTTGIATAPASSANLGPGFDCLGVALDLRCRVEATTAEQWEVAELGTTFVPKPTDFVRRAVEAAVGRPMRLVINNDVPRSRGLGSSAAVMVAGAAAALRAVGEEPQSRELYELVAAIEGHGDNAGAAVYGGLVAVAGGALRHLELSPELSFVFGIPDEPLEDGEGEDGTPGGRCHAAPPHATWLAWRFWSKGFGPVTWRSPGPGRQATRSTRPTARGCRR
jgi:homoserine kinase